MNKISKNENGFSAVEGLLIIVIVSIVGFVGWYVWHAKQSADKTLSSSASSEKTKHLNSHYAGWKKVSTAESVSLRYPSDWTYKDNSASNGNKVLVSLTAPDGSILGIEDAPNAPGALKGILITSQPFKFNDKSSSYLLYASSQALADKTTTGPIDNFTLSTSSSNAVPPTGISQNAVWLVSFTSKKTATDSTLKSNSDFEDAKLIVRSVSY